MCNLSEGVWERGVAEGENNLLMRIIANLMAKGMNFEEALNFIDVIPENVSEIKESLNLNGNA